MRGVVRAVSDCSGEEGDERKCRVSIFAGEDDVTAAAAGLTEGQAMETGTEQQ
jgi:hypothetical protein